MTCPFAHDLSAHIPHYSKLHCFVIHTMNVHCYYLTFSTYLHLQHQNGLKTALVLTDCILKMKLPVCQVDDLISHLKPSPSIGCQNAKQAVMTAIYNINI